MLAQLLFVVCAIISAYLIRRVVDEGLAGPVSAWWFYRTNRAREWELRQLTFKKRVLLDFKINIPPMPKKQEFQEWLEQMPEVTASTYASWLVQAKVKLIQRTMEALMVYRSGDDLWRETYCKYTQGLASAKSWKDASQKKEILEAELNDIQGWAQTLKAGWEQEIFQTADSRLRDQMRQQQQQQQAQQVQEMQKQQQQMQKLNPGAVQRGPAIQAAKKQTNQAAQNPATQMLTPAQLAAEEKKAAKAAAELLKEVELEKKEAAAQSTTTSSGKHNKATTGEAKKNTT